MKLIITKEESLSREGNLETWFWVNAKEGASCVGAFPKRPFLKLEEAQKYADATGEHYTKHGTFQPYVEVIAEREITFIQPTIQENA